MEDALFTDVKGFIEAMEDPIKKLLYKIKVTNSENDRKTLSDILNVMREAQRLQSKFKKVFVTNRYYYGDKVENIPLDKIKMYNSKGESYSLIQKDIVEPVEILFGKEMSGGWKVIFGDGNIPEEIELDVDLLELKESQFTSNTSSETEEEPMFIKGGEK